MNEIDTNNMKCSGPTGKFCVGDPMQPIFLLFALGVCVGGATQVIRFVLGV